MECRHLAATAHLHLAATAHYMAEAGDIEMEHGGHGSGLGHEGHGDRLGHGDASVHTSQSKSNDIVRTGNPTT
jgi:hypothetical protein